MNIILFVNLVLALATAGFGVVAVINPSRLTGGSDNAPGQRYYAQLYASRGISLGVAAGITPLVTEGRGVAVLLAAAAAAQLGDVLVGATTRTWGMCVGSAIAAGVHLTAAVVVGG